MTGIFGPLSGENRPKAALLVAAYRDAIFPAVLRFDLYFSVDRYYALLLVQTLAQAVVQAE